jgi:hypothetical protein
MHVSLRLRSVVLQLDLHVAPSDGASLNVTGGSIDGAAPGGGEAWPLAGDAASTASAAAPHVDGGLLLLRSLVCDTATPFLLFENVDFASHGIDDDAVRWLLDGAAEAMGAAVAHVALFREQGALAARCASTLDATTLRTLLHDREVHGTTLRIGFLAAMPDAAQVRAAAEAALAQAQSDAAEAAHNAADDVRLKTSLCRFWRTLGTCQRGASCHFAHGAGELCTRAPPPTAAFNPNARAFVPPDAAAAAAFSGCWFNGQVVPVTSAELEQYCSAAWFSLPLDALVMSGPHGGLRVGQGLTTALFLLDVDTGTLHGLFCALEATYDSYTPFACFACRTPPGQPLLMHALTFSMPQLDAAWHGAVALSGEDAARIDAWMSLPDGEEEEEEAWSDPLAHALPPDLDERPPSVEPAVIDDPLADDAYAAMVAQHEADEAMARALQAADDEAARVAAAAPASFASVAQRRPVAAVQPVAVPIAAPLPIPDVPNADNDYVNDTLRELYPFLFPAGAPAESTADLPPPQQQPW